jgi:phosphate transport system substrate-binding protein
MKIFKYALMLILVCGTIAVVYSSPKGKLVSYGGGGNGKVVFDARMHASKGYVCNDCHLKLFPTSRNSFITLNDHTDKACFGCHNGKTAFASCSSCHRK